MTVEICEICTVSSQLNLGGTVGRDYAEEQVGSTAHCCCLQVSCDSFISPVVLSLHSSGDFCFSNAAGKQSL